ncbi:MAG TPA: ribbon-helix-helix protein, CopG family [Gaiellaceae bacterium]
MSKLLSVSVPDDLMQATEAAALAEGQTKSEFVRETLRRQVERTRFRELQRYGRGQAEKLGIGPEDVEGIIDELRREPR